MNPFVKVLTAVSVTATATAAAGQTGDSSTGEPRYFQCSYSKEGTKHWTAVETTLSYDALIKQWRAFAETKGVGSAYCFSRYREDDPAYQSIEEVEAIGRTLKDASRVEWSPKSAKTEKASAQREAQGEQRRAQKEAEFQAKMRQYESALAEQQAAVKAYREDLARVDEQNASNARQAEAAKAEFARRQAAHEAEMERYRQEQQRYQEELDRIGRGSPGN